MHVRIHHVLPVYRDTLRVQWSIIDPDDALLSGATFRVERSGSGYEDGEWEERAAGLEDVFYADTLSDSADDLTEENQLGLRREMWYRVVLVLSDGTELASQPVDNYGQTPAAYDLLPGIGVTARGPQTQPARPHIFQPSPKFNKRLVLVQRAVQRRAMTALAMFSGVHVALLKRKHFGRRCPVCYNPATKSSLFSACDTCYGTSFDGGYYTPVPSLMRIIENPEQTEQVPEGETTILRARLETIDWPRLEKDDIIVELENNNRWIVQQEMTVRTLRRTSVTQHWGCSLLGRSHSAYRVQISRENMLQ